MRARTGIDGRNHGIEIAGRQRAGAGSRHRRQKNRTGYARYHGHEPPRGPSLRQFTNLQPVPRRRDACLFGRCRPGPVTYPAYGKAEPDEAVLQELEAKLPVAAAALKALAPSAVGAYRASLPHIAHNARFLTRNWKAVNEWMGVPPNEVLSPESQADADLHVLVIRGCDGSLYALLWCYSAEDRFGESLSAAVQKEIDLRLGKHIPCLRLPGCGANTAFTYDFGKTADLLASSVVASAMEACCDPTASVGAEKRSVILSPRDYREFYDRAEIELKLPDAVPVFERELELLRKEAPLALPAAAWAFRVGPIVVAGFPGNVFSDFILELKKRSPVKLTCATGFCGATLGYLMPSAAFDNGGFEAWPARWALPGARLRRIPVR